MFSVHWPKAPARVVQNALAPRLETLDGKTIAQLWDYIFRGDQIFALLEEALKARFPNVRFVGWEQFGNIHGEDERALVIGLPAKLKELGVDAVICGMAC